MAAALRMMRAGENAPAVRRRIKGKTAPAAVVKREIPKQSSSPHQVASGPYQLTLFTCTTVPIPSGSWVYQWLDMTRPILRREVLLTGSTLVGPR